MCPSAKIMPHSQAQSKQTTLYQRCTLPLLTFSEQARMYMGIPMTTSSQAWTAPALHSDMHVFRVSSACWRRSSCSSPSDRLCCVRLSESGLFRRSYGVVCRRGFRVRGIWKSKKWLIWIQINIKIRGYLHQKYTATMCIDTYQQIRCYTKIPASCCTSTTEICLSDLFLCLIIITKLQLSVNWVKSSFNPFFCQILTIKYFGIQLHGH